MSIDKKKRKQVIEDLLNLPHDKWRGGEGRRFIWKSLAHNVLAVAVISLQQMRKESENIEGEYHAQWRVYADAVDGVNHGQEWRDVALGGTKISRAIAEAIFPRLAVLTWKEM